MPINWNTLPQRYIHVTPPAPPTTATFQPWPPLPVPIVPVVEMWKEANRAANMYWSTDTLDFVGLRSTLFSQAVAHNINLANWYKEPRNCSARTTAAGKRLSERLGRFLAAPDTETLDGVVLALSAMEQVASPRRYDRILAIVTGKMKEVAPSVFSCHQCGCLSMGREYPVARTADFFYCESCVDSGYVVRLELEEGYLSRGDCVMFRQFPDFEDDPDSFTDFLVSSYYVTAHHLRWHGLYDAYIDRAVATAINVRGPIGTCVYDYHDGPEMGHIPSAYDARQPCVLMGLELEVEVSGADEEDNDTISEVAIDCLTVANRTVKRYMKAEHDGSLNAGFEMITGWTGLDVHEKALKQLTKCTAWGVLRSHDTSTCGLHVHIDRRSMTPLHIVKLQAFINDPKNAGLIKCIARRYNANYAKVHADRNWLRELPATLMREIRRSVSWNSVSKCVAFKTAVDCGAATGEVQRDRYSALNWGNYNTVEFRLFRGSTKLTTIMACLEFTFAAWHFTRVTPHRNLTEEAFIEFICAAENRKDTRYLRSYLHDKRFVRFYEYEQVMRPKDKRYKEPLVDVRGASVSRANRDSDCTLQELGELEGARARAAAQQPEVI